MTVPMMAVRMRMSLMFVPGQCCFLRLLVFPASMAVPVVVVTRTYSPVAVVVPASVTVSMAAVPVVVAEQLEHNEVYDHAERG